MRRVAAHYDVFIRVEEYRPVETRLRVGHTVIERADLAPAVLVLHPSRGLLVARAQRVVTRREATVVPLNQPDQIRHVGLCECVVQRVGQRLEGVPIGGKVPAVVSHASPNDERVKVAAIRQRELARQSTSVCPWVGESAVFGVKPRAMDAVALEETHLLVLPRKSFRRFIQLAPSALANLRSAHREVEARLCLNDPSEVALTAAQEAALGELQRRAMVQTVKAHVRFAERDECASMPPLTSYLGEVV